MSASAIKPSELFLPYEREDFTRSDWNNRIVQFVRLRDGTAGFMINLDKIEDMLGSISCNCTASALQAGWRSNENWFNVNIPLAQVSRYKDMTREARREHEWQLTSTNGIAELTLSKK